MTNNLTDSTTNSASCSSNASDECTQPASHSAARTPAGDHGNAMVVVREWAEMIKLEHTVFALPFALSGLILATPAAPGSAALVSSSASVGASAALASPDPTALPSPLVVLFTVLAFAGARAAAMTLNRLIDAAIDARNPRTSQRAIPQGRIKKGPALLFAVLSFSLMLGAASQLPRLCLWLSPIAIIWLSFYSFTKRFTWLCHIALGIALGGAALGGWVAAGGTISGAPPWLLALAVCTWVSGFDVIYACQDVNVDRNERLHSMPARFGVGRALIISRCLHVITICALSALGLSLGLGPIFWTGVAVIASMLVYEQSLVKANDLSRVNAAFFNVNGVVSILAFVAILLDHIC